jgi:4-aminobutyrate aminotransferase / (S)-3-amino-2-methylpropionate transaminase / 5-aminovalerate transaminase
MDAQTVSDLRQRYVSGAVATPPIVTDHASGALVTDADGTTFIDFAGGLGCLNVGHNAKPVIDAIHAQADRYLHQCFMVAMYEPYVEVCRRLAELSPCAGAPDQKSILLNSGAEAVENAVKVARYASGKDAIVGFTNAFHGRTLMAMSLTAKDMPYRHGFGPFAPEVYRVPFAYCYRCPLNLTYPSCGVACADYAADMIDSQIGASNVAAIVVEPVQGEGGFVVAPDDWLPAIKAIASERDIIFVDDEIQSGMGRTGHLFAAEHYGVVPDIVTTAKSLAAGLPLAGVTGRTELMDDPHVGGLGGTYGGNPVACAAALAVLRELTETDLLERARVQGCIIRERLDPLGDELSIIGEVRGLGPMVGLELVSDRKTKEPAKAETGAVVKRCISNGVLTLKAGTYDNVVRLLAPLVISEADLHEGLDVVTEALRWADGGMSA